MNCRILREHIKYFISPFKSQHFFNGKLTFFQLLLPLCWDLLKDKTQKTEIHCESTVFQTPGNSATPSAATSPEWKQLGKPPTCCCTGCCLCSHTTRCLSTFSTWDVKGIEALSLTPPLLLFVRGLKMRLDLRWISFPCSGNYVGKNEVFHFCFSTFAQEKHVFFWFWDIKFNQENRHFPSGLKEVYVFCVVEHFEGRCVFLGPICTTKLAIWNTTPPTKKIPEMSTFKGAQGSTSSQTKIETFHFEVKQTFVARFGRISMFCREDFQQQNPCGSQGLSWLSWRLGPWYNLVATPLSPEKSPYGYGTSTYPTGFSGAHDCRTSHPGWVLAKGTSHHFWHLFFLGG